MGNAWLRTEWHFKAISGAKAIQTPTEGPSKWEWLKVRAADKGETNSETGEHRMRMFLRQKLFNVDTEVAKGVNIKLTNPVYNWTNHSTKKYSEAEHITKKVPWGVGGSNIQRSAATCNQRQWRRKLRASKHGCQQCRNWNNWNNQLCKCFMRKKMHSTCLLELKDINSEFWWKTLNVNII